MGNIAIAYRNHLDAALLSGGGWQNGLPLINLQRPQPTEVARSADASNASTQFDADLGAEKVINIVSLVRHSAGQFATWRVRLADDAAFTEVVHDSGIQELWVGAQPFGLEPWGVFLWGGKLSEEDAKDFGIISFIWIPQGVVARYVRVEIFDENHPDGFVDVGRCYVASAFQPEFNADFGMSTQYIDPSTKVRSRGGQLYVNRKRKFRRLAFQLSFMNEIEAYQQVNELQRIAGVSGDVLVVLDPLDKEAALRQSIYGQLENLEPITHDFFDAHSVEMTLEEML